MRWLDMFKWNPKHVMHNVEDVSLKEAPFWFKDWEVELTDFKQSVAWEATHEFLI
jgi:hypothetical protein